MANQKENRAISPLEVRGQFDPTTFDTEKDTVEVIVATENPVLRAGWDGKYNEVLSISPKSVRMQRLQNGAPFLNNHRAYGDVAENVLGVVESAKIVGNEIRATVRFSKREEVQGVKNDVKDGVLRNISVGYRVYKYEVDETNDTPTYTATDWEPYEVSLVAIAADYQATVRSDEQDAQNSVELIFNNRTMEEKDKTPNAGTQPEPAKPAAPAVDEQAVRQAAIESERKRSADIMSAVRTAKLGDEFAQELIEKGSTIDEARASIIERWAKNEPVQPKGGNVSVSRDETDKRRGVIVDALVLRSGQIPEKDLKPEQVSAAREFRSLSLLDLAKDSLERSGVSTKGMDKMEMARAAISSSTSDFPVLLAGTNRRILLAAYATIPDTWRQFCAVGSVGDFREYSRLRMQSSFNKLDKVDENGEYKNKKINDAEAEKVSVDTFGNTINVTRKMIVNDDLNGFSRLAGMLGRAAARSIELDVYSLLALNSGLGPVMSDGKTLFHADHGNLISTGAGAPSVEQFEKIRLAMAKQKDKGVDDFLDLRPSIWLGPIELGGEARVVNDAQYDVNVTSKFQVPNRVRGLFGNIIDTPRLSGTAYYAFANPADEPVLEVNFLDGVQTPMMEQEETFDVDGLRWKIRMDYGVDAIGWRGAVRNAGA